MKKIFGLFRWLYTFWRIRHPKTGKLTRKDIRRAVRCPRRQDEVWKNRGAPFNIDDF